MTAMTETHQISRRRLLVSAGSGFLGVAVLSTASACSDSRAGGAASPGNPAAGQGATSGGTASSTGALTWRRVSMTFVSAYVLVRGREVAVVDTGTADSADAIGAGLTAAGAGWDAVRHIILTHKHPDHAGGLPSVAPKATAATVYAGQADIAAIKAPGKPLTALADGQEVFGLVAVATPGHTAGHLSVFDSATGVLVAGDALRTTSGLQGSDPRYTESPADAAASVKKLAELDVRLILPGHGDPLTEGAADALKRLAASLP